MLLGLASLNYYCGIGKEGLKWMKNAVGSKPKKAMI